MCETRLVSSRVGSLRFSPLQPGSTQAGALFARNPETKLRFGGVKPVKCGHQRLPPPNRPVSFPANLVWEDRQRDHN